MLAVATVQFALAKSVRISNLEPKLDVSGQIVNGHDGTFRLINGFWYYHAAEYGLCPEPPKHGCDGGTSHGCGFHGDHNVSIWRSADLSSGSWKRVGTAVHCATDVPDCGILYRPHLVQHPRTRLFLLYVNYVRKDGGCTPLWSSDASSSALALPLTNLRTPTLEQTAATQSSRRLHRKVHLCSRTR